MIINGNASWLRSKKKPPSRKTLLVGFIFIVLFLLGYAGLYKLDFLSYFFLIVGICLVAFPVLTYFKVEVPRAEELPLNSDYIHWADKPKSGKENTTKINEE